MIDRDELRIYFIRGSGRGRLYDRCSNTSVNPEYRREKGVGRKAVAGITMGVYAVVVWERVATTSEL
jgi:hypothetical protein